MESEIKEVLKEISWQIDDYEQLAKHHKKAHNQVGEAQALGVVQGLRAAMGIVNTFFTKHEQKG